MIWVAVFEIFGFKNVESGLNCIEVKAVAFMRYKYDTFLRRMTIFFIIIIHLLYTTKCSIIPYLCSNRFSQYSSSFYFGTVSDFFIKVCYNPPARIQIHSCSISRIFLLKLLPYLFSCYSSILFFTFCQS